MGQSKPGQPNLVDSNNLETVQTKLIWLSKDPWMWQGVTLYIPLTLPFSSVYSDSFSITLLYGRIVVWV